MLIINLGRALRIFSGTALSDVWLTMSDMGSVTVRLHDDVEEALRRIAEERRLPVSAVLREAIEVWTNPRVVVDPGGKLVELDVQDQLEAMDRRLGRLEEMAGL